MKPAVLADRSLMQSQGNQWNRGPEAFHQATAVCRMGRSVRARAPRTRDHRAHEIDDRRGITTGGQVALMTVGYRKVVIWIRKSAGLGYPCRVGQPSQGLRRAPQKPHNSATRRPIPTGIPRTKRHTPVHLLCVLKIRKIAGQQRRCA